MSDDEQKRGGTRESGGSTRNVRAGAAPPTGEASPSASGSYSASQSGYSLPTLDALPANVTERNEVVVKYTPLVKRVVAKLMRRLPSSVDPSDLFSSGVIGLIDAVEKFDPARCNSFRSYAEIRIRGAILDELRAQDWVPRSLRQKAHKFDKAARELESRLGRPPEEHEVSAQLGMKEKEYQEMAERLRPLAVVGYDDLGLGGTEDRMAFMAAMREDGETESFWRTYYRKVRKIIAQALDTIAERQRLVISLYYFEELTLKEIGAILGVSESRVSQIHTQAVGTLRGKVKRLLAVDV